RSGHRRLLDPTGSLQGRRLSIQHVALPVKRLHHHIALRQGRTAAAAANRPGRANARLLDGLRRLDRDGDGVVQLRDVPPRYRDLFRTLDADGDGRLRFEDIERRES
ncbi:MAG: hypothetical protein ACO3UM_14220, partial [Planctomycetota bacterium]